MGLLRHDNAKSRASLPRNDAIHIFTLHYFNMKTARVLSILFLLFSSSCQSQSKVKDDASRKQLQEAAREIMHSSGTCALITLDENGTPQVRTMDPFPPEDDFTIWLATNPKSRKVEQVKKNTNVTLYYNDKNNNGYVTLQGKAELINDQHEKDKRWKAEWKEFYPDRTDHYLLIKITPLKMEVINYARGISGDSLTWQPVEVLFKN